VLLTYSPGQNAGSRFGHLRADGTFISFGAAGTLETAPASFYFDGSGVDFAVRLANGAVHSLSSGSGRADMVLTNPNNPDVYDRIQVQFDFDTDPWADATIEVQVQGGGEGGFYNRYYPGTDEDLQLTGSINVNASWLTGQPAQVAHASDVFYPRVRSLEGQFAGAPAILVADPFTTGAPLVAIALPGVQVSPAFILLSAGFIGPAGFLSNLPIPAGWEGYHLMLQAFAVSALAGNGLFGATDAMTLTFQ
jgi:hypothetical protein